MHVFRLVYAMHAKTCLLYVQLQNAHYSFLSFATILCTLACLNHFYTRQASISLVVVSRWNSVFSCGANYQCKLFLGLVKTFLTEILIFLLASHSRSLKSTTTRPAVGGPKTFWEDQRAGDLKKRSPTSKFTWFLRFLLSAVGGPKQILRTGGWATICFGITEKEPGFLFVWRKS